jgi:hypothetical protein
MQLLRSLDRPLVARCRVFSRKLEKSTQLFSHFGGLSWPLSNSQRASSNANFGLQKLGKRDTDETRRGLTSK